jgi:hypothetical protein
MLRKFYTGMLVIAALNISELILKNGENSTFYILP